MPSAFPDCTDRPRRNELHGQFEAATRFPITSDGRFALYYGPFLTKSGPEFFEASSPQLYRIPLQGP